MNNRPALITATKLNNEGSTDSKVTRKVKITYNFKITTAKKLRMPYAVSINGAVVDKFKNAPQHINCDKDKIEIYAFSGERVGLFLNSDAHPSYRRNLIYCVTPTNHDVFITITEKIGKHADTCDLVCSQNNETATNGKEIDFYTGTLTGDIWMRISHKYTAADVDTLLANFDKLVVENVKKIYRQLERASLDMAVPESALSPALRTLSITFFDSNNATENIKAGYQFLNEGLTRVHPCGFAAIFDAAITSGVNKIRMTSTWRPMKGSIAHRAGLGLDIDLVGSTRLNRQELRGTGVGTKNVSEDEKLLFASFDAAQKREAAAHKEVGNARREIQKSLKISEAPIDTKQRLNILTAAAAAATESRKKNEAAWIAERDKTEPEEVKKFRQALIKSPSISQLFDPWVMDSNTSDNVSPESNTQADENEKLHAHHLHITVKESKIL